MAEFSALLESGDAKAERPWYVQTPALATIAVLSATVAAITAGVVLSSGEAAAASSYSFIPEQISLSALSNGQDVSHLLSVTWVIPFGASYNGTPPEPGLSPVPPIADGGFAPRAPRVLWGPSPDALTYSSPAFASTYTYTTPTSTFVSPVLLNATIGCATSAGLRGVSDCNGALTPGAPFYYQVGDDANGLSPVMQASSLPASGGASGLPTRIAVLADLGTTNNSAMTIAHIAQGIADGRASGMPFAGVVLIGDLSYADGTAPVWDVYGRLVAPLTSIIPFETAVGNHEWSVDGGDSTFTNYRNRHRTLAGGQAVPDAERLYYSFDTGLVHVTMLQGYCPEMTSTSTQPCLAPASAQMAWLLNDLSSVNRSVTPWVVVVFHQPFANSNTAHAIKTEGRPMQEAVEQVLYDLNVDFVGSGHVHAYERSCRMFNYTCVADGPVYVTIGDGGNREGLAAVWVTPQPAWSVFRQATYGHGELTAVNATHLHWAWHQNQDLVPAIADEVWLVKGQQGTVGGNGVTGVPRLSPRGIARGVELPQ
jgi:hypothetical protein